MYDLSIIKTPQENTEDKYESNMSVFELLWPTYLKALNVRLSVISKKLKRGLALL